MSDLAIERDRLVSIIRYIAKLLRSLQYGDALPSLPDNITYRQVFSVAKDHSLASTVWYVLEDEVRLSGDEELIRRFERERDVELVKHIKQSAEFASITKLFTDAKLPFLPMKGFLIKELWARPEYRTMSDMDIYVSSEHIDRAGELLLSVGYKFGHDGAVHHNYEKPPYINVELHHVVNKGSDATFSDWRPRPDNPYWYVMTGEDTLAFLLSHMYKHYVSGGCGIRAVFDILLYRERYKDEIDEDILRQKLGTKGLGWFYDMILRLIDRWFFGEVTADEELLDFEYYVLTGGTYGKVENRVELSMKKQSRFSYYLRRAFPPYSVMKYVYPWLRRVPFLLPIAWVVRLVVALFDGRMLREMRAVDEAKRKDESK